MKRFSDLKENEVLALAISSEEEDAQIYTNFANRLREEFPATATMFDEMVREEQIHKNKLLELYRTKFGERMPYITRQDVRGFLKRRPIWLLDTLRIDAVRRQAAMMEMEAFNFYSRAAERTQDVDVRKLLGDLALEESSHAARAESAEHKALPADQKEAEEAMSRRLFLLQIVQPGLAGLIDGSISTMAPIFAAAFATHQSHDAFLVGLAASIGSGISMGITEAMSDDGALSGRGKPWVRGTTCGLMTTAGGFGHTLPYLISDFWTATTVAGVLVALELWAICWIRWKYMETPFHSALIQVVLGGALVILTGIVIGNG
ncbi:MAG: ferritin family protein [Alphaproteobacteria bacterium]|nr:ferritin family protein [Alphaproteobacteria bacterium]